MTKSYKELIGQINESDKHFKTKNNNQSEIWNRLSVHGRRAEVALAKLQKGIAALKKMDDSKNYGHVGSLEKVANDLEDLVAFLGPIKEDVDIEGKESTMTESETNNSSDQVRSILKNNNVKFRFKTYKGQDIFYIGSWEISHLAPESESKEQDELNRKIKKLLGDVSDADVQYGYFGPYSNRGNLVLKVTVKGSIKESEDLNEGSNAMRTWIIHQLEQTERPHDEILADFKKKFGADKVKDFDKIVSEIVD